MDMEEDEIINSVIEFRTQRGSLIDIVFSCTYALDVSALALTDARPKCIDDICKPSSPYLVALVFGNTETGEIQLLASKPITFQNNIAMFCAVFLINMTTNIRIWQAFNNYTDNKKSLINNLLRAHSSAGEDEHNIGNLLEKFKRISVSESQFVPRGFNLNESQESAVLSCIAAREDSSSENSIKLIWGPPGTGKTKTVGSLLFALAKLKCRTLTCAPTNIAVLEVATRLLSLVKSSLIYDTYGLGDIVLFGNKKRMKIDENNDLEDIFLDTRVRILVKCFAPLTGWNSSLVTMLHFLENFKSSYLSYLLSEENKEEEEGENQHKCVMTFEEFTLKTFVSTFEQLKFCIVNLYTHLPTSMIEDHVVKNMVKALDVLKSLENSLHSLVSKDGLAKFKNDLLATAYYNVKKGNLERLTMNTRKECIEILKTLPTSFNLPNIKYGSLVDSYMMKKFCLAHSCIVLCTASSSAKLHFNEMTPLEVLVIDEAAQLKECESAVPLQLLGIRHAVLIGDERQLPALVKSKICDKADFGRSLFERMVLLGQKKHLLNVQYRMHPSISWFPNYSFYNNRISDAESVKLSSYQRRFLDGKMFGTYSFINIAYGKEEVGHGHSSKNLVEVAVVSEIVKSLFKVTDAKNRNCYFNADEDTRLAQAITTSLLEQK